MNDDGTYNLSETQARAILELRLRRLTQIRSKKLQMNSRIGRQNPRIFEILASRDRIMGIIRTELEEVKEQFAVPRRTEIVEWSGDMEDEDLIEREDMVVTVSR